MSVQITHADWKQFLDTPQKLIKSYGPDYAQNILEKDGFDTRELFLGGHAHSDMAAIVVAKADNPLLTTTTGNLYRGLGVKLWVQINTEENLWAIFRKEPWGTGSEGGVSGWRCITGQSTTLGVATAETSNLPDSDAPTFAQLFDDPRTQDKKIDSSLANIQESGRNQAVAWSQYVSYMGGEYTRWLCTQLAQQVGENAATDFTPIDQIISNYDEFTNCATINAYGDLASKFYNDTVDRSAAAAAWRDAYVDHNSETERLLTVPLLDDLIYGVRRACGIYKTGEYVMLTGTDTQERLSQLLRGHKRVTTEMYSTNASNGLRQVAGQGFGFELNRYDNIPIFVSQHIESNLSPAAGITPIYLIHLPSVSMWIDLPIVYTEHGTMFGEDILVNAHKQIGLFTLRGNLHAYYFFTMGKLRDIKAV